MLKLTDREVFNILYNAGVGSVNEIQEWRRRQLEKNLRDEFAMAAMSGMWANGDTIHGDDPIATRARYAYVMADAMLKARDA